MFTEKELMRAYGYAIRADDLRERMTDYLIGLIPGGRPINNLTFGLILKQVDGFLAK